MNNTQRFLSELHESSCGVREMLSQRGREWLAQLVADGTDRTDPRQPRNLDTDRIYELVCLFSLLSHLDAAVQLKCMNGGGSHGYRLPYGPAKKSSFAFFRFVHELQTYDMCSGTAVP